MTDKLSQVDMAIKVDRNSDGAPRISWRERTVVDARDKEIWLVRAVAFVAACLAAYILQFPISWIAGAISETQPWKAFAVRFDASVPVLIAIPVLVIIGLLRYSGIFFGLFLYKISTSMAFLVMKLGDSNNEDDDPYIFETEPYGGRTFLTVRRVLDIADHQGMRCVRIPQYFMREKATLSDLHACRNHFTYIPLKQIRGVTLEENEPYKQYPGGLSFPVPTNIFLDVGDGETFTIASHFYDKQEMRRLRALIVKHLLGSTSAEPSVTAGNPYRQSVMPKTPGSNRDDVI